MTAVYRCEHDPRCLCAEHVESLHSQLCDALNSRTALLNACRLVIHQDDPQVAYDAALAAIKQTTGGR